MTFDELPDYREYAAKKEADKAQRAVNAAYRTLANYFTHGCLDCVEVVESDLQTHGDIPTPKGMKPLWTPQENPKGAALMDARVDELLGELSGTAITSTVTSPTLITGLYGRFEPTCPRYGPCTPTSATRSTPYTSAPRAASAGGSKAAVQLLSDTYKLPSARVVEIVAAHDKSDPFQSGWACKCCELPSVRSSLQDIAARLQNNDATVCECAERRRLNALPTAQAMEELVGWGTLHEPSDLNP